MKVFLLDLWLDLREKRLAPVAIALLAGVVAVPLVLARGDAPPPPAPAQTTTATPIAPVLESDGTEAAVDDSKLQTFSPRDPFEPTEVSAPATGTGGTGGTSGTGGTGAATGTGGTGSATTGGGDTGGGATTGTGPGGTGTGTGTGTGQTTTGTRPRVFTYTVDLRFGAAGEMKLHRKVQRLELIPDEKDPKVVFLGVTTTGKTAVFLVDANLGVETDEGRCRPSGDECTFLYLRPDKDHDQARLTDADGTVFNIRLLGIDRVAVSSADGRSGDSGSRRETNSNRTPAFTGSAKDGDGDAAPGEPPAGEPSNRSTFQQFFADSSASE